VAGYSPDLDLGQKVQVLETLDVEERLRLVLGWARDTLADLTLRERIKTDVEEGMEKTQREFLLRRQLDAIRKELGELGGADEGAPDDYRAKVAERILPRACAPPSSARSTSSNAPASRARTRLDPHVARHRLGAAMGIVSEDDLGVADAKRILDEDHDGLDDVKERILEHLAVRKLRAERSLAPVNGRGAGAILALVGPPGSARPRSVSQWHAPSGASSCACPRWGPRRGRDPWPPPDLRRAQPGRLVRALREAGTMNRSSCSTRWTSSARTSAATPPRPCSRSSTRRRTTLP